MADLPKASPMDNGLVELDPATIEQLSYEEGYAWLQQVLEALEQGEVPLEQALGLYEMGVRLAAHCGRLLEEAELYVRRWQGEDDLAPFDGWSTDA